MSSTPAWNDPDSKAGTMVRGALWLVQEVGEGNTFTKHDVRTAFPEVSQADRRIRDLRAYGWVIDSNTHDVTLQPEEQRLVKIGAAVWDPRERRAAAPEAVTAKERLQAFKRDNFMCTLCGISGGDPYPEDENKIAVLAVSRRTIQSSDGASHIVLVTECSLCRNGSDSGSADIGRFLAATDDLEPQDLRRLERWIYRGRRGSTPLERAWTTYRLLPAQARPQAQSALNNRKTN
ncbi:hypothetical protein E7Z53_17010 [Kocuria salina]|uniref:hypothetical protein n=1 Tax=Kocuria salina TaxID=1929416 RepID=UPI0015942020|nr:hypothetical protein [Kocuria salina]NVC25124.1 hypothetical protein [Kocuria salina]